MIKKLLVLILIIIFNPKLFSASDSIRGNPDLKENEILVDGEVVKITSGADDLKVNQAKLDKFYKETEAKLSKADKKTLEELRAKLKEDNRPDTPPSPEDFYNEEYFNGDKSTATLIRELFEKDMREADKFYVSDLKNEIYSTDRGSLSKELRGLLNDKREKLVFQLHKERDLIIENFLKKDSPYKHRFDFLELREFILEGECRKISEINLEIIDEIDDFQWYKVFLENELKKPETKLFTSIAIRWKLAEINISIEELVSVKKELDELMKSHQQILTDGRTEKEDIKIFIIETEKTALYKSIDWELDLLDAAKTKAEKYCRNYKY